MNNSPLSPQEAARELLIRRRARENVLDYANAIEIPGKPAGEDPDTEFFAPIETTMAQHHRLILETMERISKTPHGRAMFFMPPGSAKSTYASVVFPSRYLGAEKNRKVILASYGDDLARKMGRRTRSIIKQKRFKGIFNCELTTESSAAQEFSLTNGSEYIATGILGGVTGNRAHCLRPGTLVQTNQGLIAIDELFERSFSGKVLSYEHNTKRLVYRSVKALARRQASGFYRVITAAGSVVEATGDHRFWTERGWVEARFLAEGDRLVRVLQDGDDATGLRPIEGAAQRAESDLLRALLSSKGRQFVSRVFRKGMQSLRKNWDTALALVLLGRVPFFGKAESRGESSCQFGNTDASVRGLQQAIQADECKERGQVLFAGMQGSRACDADFRDGESWMAQRMQPGAGAAAFGSIVSEGSPSSIVEGWEEVRGVLVSGQPARASHRHGCIEQSLEQSGDALRDVPPKMACGRAFEAESDVVAVVERVCESTEVYDIQVEGTECFFANGILVHNCIIIDDPVKGREQADSPVIRDKVWDAYNDDLKTRLIPGGSIIIIQTRWHEDDLAGRILPEDWKGESGPIKCRDGNVWEVVCLQARCEVQNDPLGRKIGEYLWPEWFTEKHWAQFQSNVRTWTSLYQQLPRPLEGSLFKVSSVLVDGNPVPMPRQCDYVFAILDSALKAGDKNDGTAVSYFARNKFSGHPLLILDWDITQIESDLLTDWFPTVMERLVELARICGARMGSAGAFVEDKGSGITLLQRAQRSGWPATPIDSKLTSLSKDARGSGVSDFVESGMVKICEPAYNKLVEYKGRTQNHFLSQFFGYRLGIPNQADDLYDTGVYGIAIGLGDDEGL